MENGKNQELIQKIALLLQENTKESNNDVLQSTLERINQRLETIESQITVSNPKSQIPSQKSNHPSQNKFLNLEELADQIINSIQNEKACPYEPTGKPCDHCSMCNSLGF